MWTTRCTTGRELVYIALMNWNKVAVSKPVWYWKNFYPVKQVYFLLFRSSSTSPINRSTSVSLSSSRRFFITASSYSFSCLTYVMSYKQNLSQRCESYLHCANAFHCAICGRMVCAASCATRQTKE